MELKEVLGFIKNSSSLNSLKKEDLNELISKYPWFSTIHLLRSKQAQIENNSELENILSTSALFANNRQSLFELMYPSAPDKIFIQELDGSAFKEEKKVFEEEKKTVEINEPDEVETELIHISDVESVMQIPEFSNDEKEVAGDHEEKGIVAVENSATEVQKENLSVEFEALGNSGSAAEFIYKEIGEDSDEPEIETADTEITATNILENEFIRNEVNEMAKEMEVELLSLSEITHKNDELETEEEGIAEEKFDSEIESNKILEAETEFISNRKDKMEVDESKEYSFLDWLKQLSSKEILEEKKPSTQATPLLFNTEKVLALKPKEEIVPLEHSHDILISEPLEDIKVIDNFVAGLKRKPVEKNLSSEKRSEESLLEDIGFATETLAKILVEQGKFQKAISMYETLSLIYPDKSLLFAPLIKELKKKI